MNSPPSNSMPPGSDGAMTQPWKARGNSRIGTSTTAPSTIISPSIPSSDIPSVPLSRSWNEEVEASRTPRVEGEGVGAVERSERLTSGSGSRVGVGSSNALPSFLSAALHEDDGPTQGLLARAYQLESKCLSLEKKNTSLESELSRLHKELAASKAAEASSSLMLSALNVHPSRVSVLIDVVFAFFDPVAYLSHGEQGGREASKDLVKAVTALLPVNARGMDVAVKVSVCAEKVLRDVAIGHPRLGITRETISRFVLGFNQASGLMCMVDFGSDRYKADLKMSEYAIQDLQCPQVHSVYFSAWNEAKCRSTLEQAIHAPDPVVLMDDAGYFPPMAFP